MSHTDFLKGECSQCAGHLEYPASAAGETIVCPHCGWPTELPAPAAPPAASNPSRRRLVAGIAGLLVVSAILAGGLIFFKKNAAPTAPTPPVVAAPANNLPTHSPVMAVAPPAPKDEFRTNDFGISGIGMRKTPGDSLVYVTGKLRNLSGRQRFGVKLAFTLLDRHEQTVGTATDYVQLLEPNGTWDFKALVLDSKAVTAQLGSVLEDQ